MYFLKCNNKKYHERLYANFRDELNIFETFCIKNDKLKQNEKKIDERQPRTNPQNLINVIFNFHFEGMAERTDMKW